LISAFLFLPDLSPIVNLFSPELSISPDYEIYSITSPSNIRTMPFRPVLFTNFIFFFYIFATPVL